MSLVRFVLAALLLVFPLAAPVAAQVEVIYDTFPDDDPATNSGRFLGTPESSADSFQYADPFVVSGGDFELDAVTVRLRSNPSFGPGDAVVRIWNDAGGQPGAVLHDWTIASGDIATIGNVELVATLEVLLADGETYWVGIAMAQPGTRGVWFTADFTMSDGWRFARTHDANPVWNFPLISGDPLGLARIDAIPVPEPGGTLMALVALAVSSRLVGLRERRGSLPRSRRHGPPSSTTSPRPVHPVHHALPSGPL